MTLTLPPGWRTAAHAEVDPAAGDWRAELAARLGQRPRRVGPWAELALLGALRCLDTAGETALPGGAALRVASLGGPRHAFEAIAGQARAQQLPRPFDFMQCQPSHALATLSQALRWQGDARFVLGRDRGALLRLALLECGAGGLLFGWVEEDRTSAWWRILPA